MTNVRSLLVIAIWCGLAIGVTVLVSQMLSASQVGRTAPRKSASAPIDTIVGEFAVIGQPSLSCTAGAFA